MQEYVLDGSTRLLPAPEIDSPVRGERDLSASPASPALLQGEGVRRAFAIAAQYLREAAAAIDAINEYPVPDGDTGSNMSATLDRAIEQAIGPGEQATTSNVLKALARGALFGARGNSGVILSQALKGLASGVGEIETIDAKSLASGVSESARAAYSAVSKPSEGTMLTVLRVAGEAAAAAASNLPNGGLGTPCLEVLRTATAAAEEAEAETMNQLPELLAAGVPDAGGEGICVILRGLVAALSGEAARAPILPPREISIQAGHSSDSFGFCTEFLIEPIEIPLNPESVRAMALENGSVSVVVVGDETLVRVHAHTPEPRALVSKAESMGRVSRVKIEDMAAQHVRLRETGSGAGTKAALLALSHGKGFDDLFHSIGASTAPMGEIVKPSAGDIARAADALQVADVVVLPNHRNVLLAAQQAASIARSTIHIVPSTSFPEGIAAALAYDSAATPANNVRAMTEAMQDIVTLEVTTAQSNRVADGISVRAGQAIGMLAGSLVAATDDATSALLAGLKVADVGSAALLTIYAGESAPALDTGEIEELFPGVEVQVLSGGQQLYQFIASIEQ
jgi:DAK2 domain fusion protein YloV